MERWYVRPSFEARKSAHLRMTAVLWRSRSSVRRGRRGCRGLRRGLRRAADDHGVEALAPQPLGGLPRVIEGHRIDDGIAALDVIDAEPIDLVLQQRRGKFRGAVELQHLRAL